MKQWIQLACAALLPAVLAACEAQPAQPPQPARQGDAAIAEGKPMKASKTYLYLLRKTPFFTSQSTSQLRWTIDHSREWEVERGTVITQCAGAGAADAWVLLDGGWQLEHEGRAYPAGHADPGKWFSARQASGTCRLVATGHGYVMQIARAEFDAMLAQGFAFDKHLDAGCRYYAEIFGNAPAGVQGQQAAPR